MSRFTSLLALLASCVPYFCLAQSSNPMGQLDPFEVRMPTTWEDPTASGQGAMFASPSWRSFAGDHDRWQVVFDQSRGMVHRAFGPAISGVDPSLFIEQRIDEWAPGVVMGEWTRRQSGDRIQLRGKQFVDGRPVRGTEAVVTSAPQGITSWGVQAHIDAEWPSGLMEWEDDELIAQAAQGLDGLSAVGEVAGEWLLPALEEGSDRWRFIPVAEVVLSGVGVDLIPFEYHTMVDLQSGSVVERINAVRHSHVPPPGEDKPRFMGPPALQAMACQIMGTVQLTQPFEPTSLVPFDHLFVTLNGGTLTTANGGQLNIEGNDPLALSIPLSGLWSDVATNGNTPAMEAMIEGDTVLVIDPGSNLRERSAYHSVGRIHDHMKSWLPEFDGLDFPLPTNVDVSGTCNAFYTPGDPTINFYTEGDGCNAFSLVSDVVYHEYGHGINDLFYESIGGNFINGAMGEGYADFWAISLTDNPVLGAGCYTDNPEFFIRRYDEDPKVYPQDLVGQVHADGEIICGAWWDTHLLMGADWDQTMSLFISAYGGMQAETANGNEGEAFVEVLLAVLEADDDDADISNGTPNGAAILEGFAIHGITLFSNVAIGHEAAAYAEEETPLSIDADADILFPLNLSQFFSSLNLYYRTSPFAPWEEVVMDDNGNGTFSGTVPAQPMGTVVEYHFAIQDDFGALSSITPYSSNDAANPNLPYNTMIGVTPVLVDDQDDYSDFGFWSTEGPDDNATTGQWESTIPVGSFSDGPGNPSSICAPDEDHTPGDGIFCFLTGVSPGQDAGIGSNDVDGGHTTLESEDIDLGDMMDPVMSYWRWYVNAPATGANPGADWWQVSLSDDGGQTWVKVEETLTQDISWRRNAFRIQEYVDLTDAFRIRFVASDSIRVGQELDGGSLIEAAVDDLVIHDLVVVGIDQPEASGIAAWPVPFGDRLHAAGWAPHTPIRLLDPLGREVHRGMSNARGEVHWTVPPSASGTYILTGEGRGGHARSKELLRINP